MPRKKSIKKSATDFISKANQLEDFVGTAISGLSSTHESWCNDYAVIRLYMEFEKMMLSAIIGAINNDSKTISESAGVKFPKHLLQKRK